MENKQQSSRKSKNLEIDELYSCGSSDSSIPMREDGRNKNFKDVEDEFITYLIEKHYKDHAPTTTKDYRRLCAFFNNDIQASQFGKSLPYYRDINSIKRRLHGTVSKTLSKTPPTGSAQPTHAESILMKLGQDPEFIESSKEKKRNKEEEEESNNHEKSIKVENGEQEQKRQKKHSFWDHPNASLLLQTMSNPNNDDNFHVYEKRKKALEQLRDEQLISFKVYENRIKQLAITFGLIGEDDC